MVQVIPVILTFHTYGTGISAGIISDLYRDHICSADLPTVALIGPFLVWFSAFLAVLVGEGPQ